MLDFYFYRHYNLYFLVGSYLLAAVVLLFINLILYRRNKTKGKPRIKNYIYAVIKTCILGTVIYFLVNFLYWEYAPPIEVFPYY